MNKYPQRTNIINLVNEVYPQDAVYVWLYDTVALQMAYHGLPSQASPQQVIQHIIDFAEEADYLDALLDLLKAQNLEAFEQHQPYFGSQPTQQPTAVSLSSEMPQTPQPSRSSQPTINRQEILASFEQMLQPNSPIRILRLEGDAKLGKSHFMTKVFPAVVDQASIPSAILDLRSQTRVSEILDALRGHPLDALCDFEAFDEAYQNWILTHKVDMQSDAFNLAQVLARSQRERDSQRKIIPLLTRKYITDLRTIDQTIFFLFDTVDEAEASTLDWLLNAFLAQLASLSHVRVVVAGRTLPEQPGSYARFSEGFKLEPVHDEHAYRAYCEAIGLQLDDQMTQSIPLFMQGAAYKPGLFADFMSNLQGVARV